MEDGYDYPSYSEEETTVRSPADEGSVKVAEATITTTTAVPLQFEDYPFYTYNETDEGYPYPVDGAGVRVYGGRNAWNGQFPHQVSLQNANGHFCGASVINPLLLLTAAHCLANIIPTDIRAVTGALDLRNLNASVQTRTVVHAIEHEKYNSTTWENDIAILVLNESLVFNEFTQPIEIYERGAAGKKGAVVSGWGKMENQVPADVLQFASILFSENRTSCRQTYAGLKNPRVITEKMFCAGGRKADTCEGDSGGPLTCFKYSASKNRDQVYLCGIVSFGIGCQSGHPGIYTDVSTYYGWIQKHMSRGWRQHYMTVLGKPLEGGDQCDAGMFRCANSGACIPEEFKCDGINDCDPLTTRNYDEEGCISITCPYGKFKCDNSTCLPSHLICDGKKDCQDETDEKCDKP